MDGCMEDSKQHQAGSSLPLAHFFPIREGGRGKKVILWGCFPPKAVPFLLHCYTLIREKFLNGNHINKEFDKEENQR